MYTALMYKSELPRPARYPHLQPAGEGGGGGRGCSPAAAATCFYGALQPPGGCEHAVCSFRAPAAPKIERAALGDMAAWRGFGPPQRPPRPLLSGIE